MDHSITIKRKVEFSETDMAGIVHFSNFYKWMEAAEAAFFRSIGLSIVEQSPGEFRGWPRVETSCTFKSPLKFEDDFEVTLTIKEIRNHSLVYEFDFQKLNSNTSKTAVATGAMTTVYAKFDVETGKIQPALLPEELTMRLKAHAV